MIGVVTLKKPSELRCTKTAFRTSNANFATAPFYTISYTVKLIHTSWFISIVIFFAIFVDIKLFTILLFINCWISWTVIREALSINKLLPFSFSTLFKIKLVSSTKEEMYWDICFGRNLIKRETNHWTVSLT